MGEGTCDGQFFADQFRVVVIGINVRVTGSDQIDVAPTHAGGRPGPLVPDRVRLDALGTIDGRTRTFGSATAPLPWLASWVKPTELR